MPRQATIRPRLLAIALPVVLAAIVYAPLFGGFWLGDDGPNLHRAYALAQDHRLASETARLFFSALPSGGTFYRPLVLASFSVNYALADAHYGGWFAMNFALHLAATALVAAIVLRLGERLACDARIAALVAASLFALAPLGAEAVYWVSARSDDWVAVLSLLVLYAWAGEPSSAGRRAFALPLLLPFALGFKESAAVLPLQMALVAWAWPRPRPRRRLVAIAIAFGIVAAWFALRAHLFGSVWQVYGAEGGGTLWRFDEALRSIPAWWHAQFGTNAALAASYTTAIGIGALVLVATCRGGPARMAAALAAAGAGLSLATLLNVGLHASGEGGRNFYVALAWLALAAGVALATPRPLAHERGRKIAVASLALAAIAGGVLLHFKVQQVLAVEQRLRAFASALPEWASTHPGLTMVVVPEMDGPVVTLRNAQAAIALPPIQREALLHRTLPTLPRDLAARHDQLAHGLATRLSEIAPTRADEATIAKLAEPAAPLWPPIACWSPTRERLIALPAVDPADATRWRDALLAAARVCTPTSGE